MMLKNRNVLLISPEPWDHIFVSKHHYAVHLAALRNTVYFVNPPSSSQRISKTNYSNLHIIDYTGFVKGLRFFPVGLQRLIIRRKFELFQHLAQTQFDVVWSFDNSVFFDFSALPKGVLCISHIVDLNQDFQTKQAASTATICLACSDVIVKKLRQYQNRTFKINHGVNIMPEEPKPELRTNQRPLAVYAGNLSIPYIDWALIKEGIETLPNVDFLFFGPYKEDSPFIIELKQFSNVNFKGVVSANNLQAEYLRADVLLIAYKAEEFADQVSNPHKMMEYLMSGRVIVATFTREYSEEANRELLVMASHRNEFVPSLKRVIKDLAYWNNSALQGERRAFARDNSYAKQIERIEEIIGK